MGEYVAHQVIKLMNKKGVLVKDANILLLGITFKENCPDIRNTKVVDIFSTLAEYTNNITIYDPWASEAEVQHEYQLNITNTLPQENKYDAIILAVSHNEFLNIDIKALLNDNGVVYDVKGVLDRNIIDGRL
jgi:UDP-N-acetyl-D-galactosamine dehydrogenase